MTTKTLAVYDPAMCCSTGVCGPDVDPKLVGFAADLDWLAQQGVQVTRYNLAQQPGAFVAEPLVKDVLQEAGEAALPLLLIGKRTVMSGTYPTRDQLAAWFALSTSEPTTQPKARCNPKSGCC